jgi:hypothetical protein
MPAMPVIVSPIAANPGRAVALDFCCFGSLMRFLKRLAHPRRGWKSEFKLERYPPLDGAAYCSVCSSFLCGSDTTDQRQAND